MDSTANTPANGGQTAILKLTEAISKMGAAACLNDTPLGKFVYSTCNGAVELIGAIEADLRAALAAPAELPVAWMKTHTKECTSTEHKKWMERAGFGVWDEVAAQYTIPLYSHPAAPAIPTVDRNAAHAAVTPMFLLNAAMCIESPHEVATSRKREVLASLHRVADELQAQRMATRKSEPAAQPAAQVADIQASRTLVRFILENAGKFEWSLQGLGMLRLYLTRDIRLHVWDSRFAFADVSPIHDHLQWGLESTIIAGRLTNYRFAESSDGDDYLYSTLKPGYGCYFKHEPLPIKLQRGQAEEYSAGMSYSQRPNEIHLSAPEDGTVTLMRKTPTADGDSARVFWPADQVWGSAEPRPATSEEVAAITQYALSVWQDTATPATVKTAEGE